MMAYRFGGGCPADPRIGTASGVVSYFTGYAMVTEQ
jgi:hypothetical protein